MTEQHPITPPPELLSLWMSEDAPWDSDSFGVPTVRPAQLRHVATQAARWGWEQRDATVPAQLQQARDEELEACCEHLKRSWSPSVTIDNLRAARRPKPPSLKELALKELESLRGDANAHGLGFDAPAICRALEALPE